MRRFLWLPVVAALLCIAIPQIAFAHVLDVDGGVGAVLHIKPDDAPIDKVPVEYTLAFQDNGGNFSLKSCDCQVAFIAAGKTIEASPLVATSDTVSDNTVTFPKADVYTMQVSGKPKGGAHFDAFSLNYTIRVTSGQMDTQAFPAALWIGIGMAMALILLGGIAMEYSEGSEKNRGDL